MRLNGSALALGLLSAGLFAQGAQALQFPLPSVNTRLHTLASGQPGAEWNSGSLSYSSGTGLLTLVAEVDVLNYYDPGIGACPTDVGSNCAEGFSPDQLDLTVNALFDSLLVTPLGGGFFQIDLNFKTTGGTDITVVDPTDNTTVLTASWQAGTFQSFPTTGLTVTAIYDGVGGDLATSPSAVGFTTISGGVYSQLFDPSGFGLDISAIPLSSFSPSTASIVDTILDTGTLPSFTAGGAGSNEALGQVFRIATGDFEAPEPGALLGLGGAVLAMAAVWRRRS